MTKARETIKATIQKDGLNENGKNYSKETISTYNIVARTARGLTNCITCRVYMGRSRNSSTVYASVWLYGKDCYGSGSGQAGGYGYHKESAAINDALQSAGIVLSSSVHGTGEHEDALKATARALGYTGELLVITN
jgi:hypothetical protein